MKKSLFLLATAALVLASCNNDVKIAENKTLGNEPQEIVFSALTQNTKRIAPSRAAVDGTTFPIGVNMKVSALDLTNHREFFSPTEFHRNSTTGLWEGTTQRYWPLSAVQVNFLAIANEVVANANDVTWNTTGTASSEVQSVVVVMDNNYAASTTQKDFMYAIGYGQVTENGNNLSFPAKIDMSFKHAQAYLVFNLKAADNASKGIHITNLELTGVYTKGTATVARTNAGTYADDATSLTWDRTAGVTDAGSYRSITYNASTSADVQAAIDQQLTTSFVETGHLLVVPAVSNNTASDNGDTKLRISYTLDGKAYNKVISLNEDTYDQGKKYIYNITFKLHEIVIAPVVTEWITDLDGDAGTNDDVNILIPSIPYVADGTPTVSIGHKAATYTFDISGVPSGTYTIAEGSTGTDFVKSVNVADNGDGSLTVTVTTTGGNDNETRDLKLKESGVDKMTITLKLSNTAVDE